MGIFAAHSRFLWFVGLGLLAVVSSGLVYVFAPAEHGTRAPSPLDHAIQLAELNNWTEAEREFRKAAKVFSINGDRRGALYSQLGIIRATAQHRNLVDLVAQLDEILGNEPLLKSDRRLRMFCLTIRGDVDGEMKSREMRKDWEEVAILAKELGNTKWRNRALAQIGFAAFYEGDLSTGKKNVLTALLIATGIGDIGEQVMLLYAIGLGLDSQKEDKKALAFFNRASPCRLRHLEHLTRS
jgi:hypothetical protein